MNPLFKLRKLPAIVAACSFSLALLFSTQSCKAMDDFGTWQWFTLNVWQQDKFTGSLFSENRWIDDSSQYSLFLFGPQLRHQTWSHTSFAVGAYYLHVPRGYLLEDTDQWWLDVEMLNCWKATENLSFTLRTMPEHRWMDDPHDDKQCSRHRIGATYLTKNLGPLQKVYANSEFFLDWESGDINENRFIPCGLTFKINDSINLDLFPMIRSQEVPSHWKHDFIIGTHLVWKL